MNFKIKNNMISGLTFCSGNDCVEARKDAITAASTESIYISNFSFSVIKKSAFYALKLFFWGLAVGQHTALIVG